MLNYFTLNSTKHFRSFFKQKLYLPIYCAQLSDVQTNFVNKKNKVDAFNRKQFAGFFYTAAAYNNNVFQINGR